MSKTGTLATTLGTLQPFRYRGHIFDEETAIYYLSSQFYNPSIGHFIAVDATDVLTTSLKSLTEKNLYAYCDNNPVMRKDIDGARSVLTSYVINVEVKMMEKKEFLSICDSTLKEMDFSKKGGAYYLNIGSDLVGAVFFRKSNFGSVYYVECGIAI